MTAATPEVPPEAAAALERVLAAVAAAAEGEADFAAGAGAIVAVTRRFLAGESADREHLRLVDPEDLFSMIVSTALISLQPGPVAPPPLGVPTTVFEGVWRGIWFRLPQYARVPHNAASILARCTFGACDEPDEAGQVVEVLLRVLAVEAGLGLTS